MKNDPVFVEIYASREGVWAWSVSFDDLALCQSGTEKTFLTALSQVMRATAEGQAFYNRSLAVAHNDP